MSITWTTWFCVRQAAETCEYFVIDKLCLGVSRCPYTKFWGRVLCALASVSGTISRPRIVRYINRCRCRRRLMPIVLLTSRLATPPVTHRSTGFTILWRNLYCFLAATTHQDWFNAFFPAWGVWSTLSPHAKSLGGYKSEVQGDQFVRVSDLDHTTKVLLTLNIITQMMFTKCYWLFLNVLLL